MKILQIMLILSKFVYIVPPRIAPNLQAKEHENGQYRESTPVSCFETRGIE
jgi:hypothetical protein